MDDTLKTTLKKIPLLTVNAGPRDGEQWIARMKEELKALIAVCV
jgi:ufm1-conjugating enzyme 1